MAAVYGWDQGRYNAKDAFRMGNDSLLGYAGGNIALEFLYGGPHSWLSRMHLLSFNFGPPRRGDVACPRGEHAEPKGRFWQSPCF
jgi:hypothetical protein